jgi:uncharacterized protein with HEPN domain
MKRDYSLFLKDILQAIENIESFIGDMDFDAFFLDKKTRGAVVREIEVIGDASKNIPKDILDRHKELPWQDMARMRDKFSYVYFGLNYVIVWKVVKERLPEIKVSIVNMLDEIAEDISHKDAP